jgi:hypothetical protein
MKKRAESEPCTQLTPIVQGDISDRLAELRYVKSAT